MRLFFCSLLNNLL